MTNLLAEMPAFSIVHLAFHRACAAAGKWCQKLGVEPLLSLPNV